MPRLFLFFLFLWGIIWSEMEILKYLIRFASLPLWEILMCLWLILYLKVGVLSEKLWKCLILCKLLEMSLAWNNYDLMNARLFLMYFIVLPGVTHIWPLLYWGQSLKLLFIKRAFPCIKSYNFAQIFCIFLSHSLKYIGQDGGTPPSPSGADSLRSRSEKNSLLARRSDSRPENRNQN